MTTIGKVAYVATFDATDLSKGMLSAQQMFRAQKKITEEMRSPLEQYQTGLTNLEKLVEKYPATAGRKVEMERQLEMQYLRAEKAVRQLTAAEASRLRELTAGERAVERAAASEQRLNRARKEAGSVVASTRTANEEYSRSLARLTGLHRKGLIDLHTYQRAVKQLRVDYISSIPVIGRFGAALANPAVAASAGVLAGVAVAVTNVRKEMAYLDTVAKDAARLDMSPEAFIVLSRAASHAGVEQDRLFDSMAKLQKKLGEASMGSKQAAQAFSTLGLSYDKIQQMSKQDQFIAVTNALAGVRDNTQRLTIANEIFGKSGTELLTMLTMTTSEFERLRDEMDRRGELFSASDLAQVEAASDAIADLGAHWRAFWQRATVEVSPVLRSLTFVLEKLAEMKQLQSFLWNAAKLTSVPLSVSIDAGKALSAQDRLQAELEKASIPEVVPQMPDPAEQAAKEEKAAKPQRDLAAERREKQAQALVKLERQLITEAGRSADIETRRAHLVEQQLEMRKKMAELPEEQQAHIGTIVDKLNSQMREIDDRRQRDETQQRQREAASKTTTSIRSGSQEAYQYLIQAIQNNPQDRQRQMRETRSLALSERQTEILQRLLDTMQDMEPIGSAG
jgi:hypothetical protein